MEDGTILLGTCDDHFRLHGGGFRQTSTTAAAGRDETSGTMARSAANTETGTESS